jgi:hypothetical protein
VAIYVHFRLAINNTIIAIKLPSRTRALADTRLFPDKMFNALDISPSVYVRCSSKDYDPYIRNLNVQGCQRSD